MSDGGYSRLEKDFLGNERMVHYDAGGNILGASDVVREEDGTIRISNDQSPLNAADKELPVVEAIVPPPTSSSASAQSVRSPFAADRQRMPMNQVVMYSIAAFIATSLLTLGVLSFLRSKGPDARIQTTDSMVRDLPQQNQSPAPQSQPDQENFPPEPRPRNDEQPAERPPFDQAAPDSNMDDSRPRIRDENNSAPEDSGNSIQKSKKGPEDPIDLRGDEDGKKDPNKKGDPNADPLKGDDIH